MRSQAFLKILYFFLFATLFILASGSATDANSKDPIEVTRDEEKITYSIGPSEKKSTEKTEEEKDKERAWEMLKNMNTVIDKRGQKGQKSGQQPGE